jgi:hypothetical protein
MIQSGRPLTFAVLVGAGAMGRITVRDLSETTASRHRGPDRRL